MLFKIILVISLQSGVENVTVRKILRVSLFWAEYLMNAALASSFLFIPIFKLNFLLVKFYTR